jgi:hypothetical protein
VNISSVMLRFLINSDGNGVWIKKLLASILVCLSVMRHTTVVLEAVRVSTENNYSVNSMDQSI